VVKIFRNNTIIWNRNDRISSFSRNPRSTLHIHCSKTNANRYFTQFRLPIYTSSHRSYTSTTYKWTAQAGAYTSSFSNSTFSRTVAPYYNRM